MPIVLRFEVEYRLGQSVWHRGDRGEDRGVVVAYVVNELGVTYTVAWNRAAESHCVPCEITGERPVDGVDPAGGGEPEEVET